MKHVNTCFCWWNHHKPIAQGSLGNCIPKVDSGIAAMIGEGFADALTGRVSYMGWEHLFANLPLILGFVCSITRTVSKPFQVDWSARGCIDIHSAMLDLNGFEHIVLGYNMIQFYHVSHHINPPTPVVLLEKWNTAWGAGEQALRLLDANVRT
jgi:hypothetical protein